MTDVLSPVEVGHPPPARPRIRRRWPRWLIVVTVLILGAILATFWMRESAVGSQRPFRWGSGFYDVEIDGIPDKEIKRAATHGTYPEPQEVVTLPFAEGKRVRVLFPLYNPGPRDVTLTEVSLGPRAPEYVTLLQPEQVRLAPGPESVYEREALPFEPSLIKAEENRLLVLEWRFVCQRGGTGQLQGRDFVNIRYELLGRSQWQQMPLPFRLMLTYPPKGTCQPLR